MKFASDLRQVSCFLRVLPVSSTNKTDRQNITEILLNMESKTIHSPHDLENEVRGLKVTVEKKEHAIKALREEKDDCLNRYV
jgi:hypothetical protein